MTEEQQPTEEPQPTADQPADLEEVDSDRKVEVEPGDAPAGDGNDA